MKKNILLIISSILIFSSSCNNKEQSIETANFIFNNECKLTKEDSEIAKQIKEHLFRHKNSVARSEMKKPNHWITAEEIEKSIFVMQNYYELDTTFFSTDLDEKKIHEYIKPAKNKRLFFGKNKGKYSSMVIAEQQENIWFPKIFIEDATTHFKELFDWLLPALQISSDKKFYVLNAMGTDYFVYKTSEGKFEFRTMPGNFKMNSIQFINSIVNDYNNLKYSKEDLIRIFEKRKNELKEKH